MLNVIGIGRQALNKAVFGFGKHALLFGDKVLNINITHNVGNFGAAVVREFITKIQCLGLYNIKYTFVTCQNCLALFNKVQFFLQFVKNFLFFKTRQLT